jgi:CHASE1-domain containing sensor protein
VSASATTPGPGPPRAISLAAAAPIRSLLRSRGRGRWSLWALLTTLLVIGGTLTSVLGARAVARSDADKARLGFHLAAAEIASTLKLAIEHEEDLVVSTSAYVTANPNASPASFDRWIESVHAMRRFPELQNIGLVTLVPATRLAAFQSHMAANPLRPLGPDSIAPAGSQAGPARRAPAVLLPRRRRSRAQRQDIPPGRA